MMDHCGDSTFYSSGYPNAGCDYCPNVCYVCCDYYPNAGCCPSSAHGNNYYFYIVCENMFVEEYTVAYLTLLIPAIYLRCPGVPNTVLLWTFS